MRAFWNTAVLLAAVASATCGKPPAADNSPVPSGERVLGEDEIMLAQAGTMYDVVRMRRPSWLRRSTTRPTFLTEGPAELVVYLDGQRFGGPESLQRLTPPSVRWAEYLTPSEAQARFGQGHLGGVIHVHTHGTPGN